MITLTLKLPNKKPRGRGKPVGSQKPGPSGHRAITLSSYGHPTWQMKVEREFRTMKAAVRFCNSIYRQLGVPIPKDEPRP